MTLKRRAIDFFKMANSVPLLQNIWVLCIMQMLVEI